MKITIPKPCHENWNTMTHDEKGRFCAVCSKTVKDFRNVQDDEIIDVFAKATEEICGNFNLSQLNRDLHYSYINALLVKFAVGVMLTTGGMVRVNAQQNKANDTLKIEEIQDVVLSEFRKERRLLGSVSVVSMDALACKEKEGKGAVPDVPKIFFSQISPNVHPETSAIRIGGVPSSGAKPYNPLYVVDGKISDYEKVKALDPNVIKTVNVLKEASATAKYGKKAKGGVVVITTKRKDKK